MVAIVLVSHSAAAAEGIRDIAAEMGGAETIIVPAGGGPDGGVGTTVPRIRTAIEEATEATTENGRGDTVDDGDGVVVLVDLGSAVMNTELAIEMVTENREEVDVRIADAPLVEGALNAAVEATNPRATVDSVLTRAEEAREYRKLA